MNTAEKLAQELDRLGRDGASNLSCIKDGAAELRRLAAENLRLAGEVANRNARALKGDEATALREHHVDQIMAFEAENERLQSALQFVERWANHHATKPHMTADQALSVIQHSPAITAITNGYADGRVPDTYDPYAENERLRADAERYRWLRHGDNDEPCLKFTQESRAGTNDAWLLRGHELDVAIDAATKETP